MMGFIIFEKHPGDILQIVDINKNQITLTVGSFYLKVTGMIKPTFNKMFKVPVEFPSNKHPREALIRELDGLILKREIVEYVTHS
jgi:hypothetical protein